MLRKLDVREQVRSRGPNDFSMALPMVISCREKFHSVGQVKARGRMPCALSTSLDFWRSRNSRGLLIVTPLIEINVGLRNFNQYDSKTLQKQFNDASRFSTWLNSDGFVILSLSWESSLPAARSNRNSWDMKGCSCAEGLGLLLHYDRCLIFRTTNDIKMQCPRYGSRHLSGVRIQIVDSRYGVGLGSRERIVS
jgi:hypothetical protein